MFFFFLQNRLPTSVVCLPQIQQFDIISDELKAAFQPSHSLKPPQTPPAARSSAFPPPRALPDASKSSKPPSLQSS